MHNNILQPENQVQHNYKYLYESENMWNFLNYLFPWKKKYIEA